MKACIFILMTLVFTLVAYGDNVKISQLPLGSAATTGINDSFPYVAAGANITKRLTVWDIASIPTVVATYAPLASPTFTGTVTAPTFVGALTGNASTATALAANPTDCTAGQYANAIAANGNLTCAAVSTSQISGTVGVSQGGTGLTGMPTNGQLPIGNGTGYTLAALTGTTNQISVTNGAGTITLATPQNIGTASSPSFTGLTLSGFTTGVVHSNGSGVLSSSAVALTSDVSGTLPIANGGTNNASLGVTAGGSVYADGSKLATTAAGTSGQLLKSNGASPPTWTSLSGVFTAPTIQKFTSGTAQTYTTPANVLYIRVRMVGGGGGGSGSGAVGTPGTAATAGGNTTFGTTLLVANGGGLGPFNSSGGAGGTASLGTGPIGTALTGGSGSGGQYTDGINIIRTNGGAGASSFFGGAGGGGRREAPGQAAATNTGSGGGGGGCNSTVTDDVSGSGGGAGGFVDAIITSPAATYTYTVGTAGAGGAASATGGAAGGNGAAGYIEVTEYYQ